MQVYKTYKFRMYPNREQQITINKFVGTSRFIYNYCLGKIIEKNIDYKNISYMELYKELLEVKKDNPWIDEVDTEIIRTTLEDLQFAFKRHNIKKAAFPRFKSKLSCYDSYRTICRRWLFNNCEYSNIKVNMKEKLLTIPKIKNIPIRGYRKKTEFNDKIINATIIKEAGRYYASICVLATIKDVEFMPKKMIGIDIGLNSSIITSDGDQYESLWKKQEKFDKRLQKLHHQLSNKQKYSNNYKKMRAKIKRQNMKIKNLNKYTLHEITKNTVRENDIIFVENLNTKEMIESSSRFIGRRISSSCFSETIRQLSYKANWYNKRLIKIDRYYPSSQLCSHCKSRNNLLENYRIRVFRCPKCGLTINRDINASINILDRGIELCLKNEEIKSLIENINLPK